MRRTRDAVAARKPTGNTVPRTIGTSPKTSPGSRSPTTIDPVDRSHRFDPPLEHSKQRAIVACVRRVLTRHQADVRRNPGKTLVLGRVEHREHLAVTTARNVASVRAGQSAGRVSGSTRMRSTPRERH
jgi:hypothetical protein